jgi:hypothetical protein
MKATINKKTLLNKIINNKYVLYVVALIALLDVIGYVVKEQFSAVLFLYLVGMITYYYTKNMTVVLGTALVVTTIVDLIKYSSGFKEGFNEGNNKKTDDKKDKKDKKIRNLLKDVEKDVNDVEYEEEEDEITIEEDIQEDEEKDEDEKKDAYQNLKLTPSLYNMPNKKQLSKQLGKADKLEAAYDDLEKVIGENGIKSVSNNTKELVKQQQELLSGLKDITPALNEAMGAIGKIDLGGLSNMFKKTAPSTE